MSDRPNIVIIMTDQQRADLVAREGYPLDTMPFCDRLAAEGQWFDRAYTTCPACVPARVSMLTGRFGSATRIRCNDNSDWVADGELVALLRDAGYRTALCGKKHSPLPEDRYDDFLWYGHQNAPADTAEERAFNAFLQEHTMHLVREPTPFPAELQYPCRIVDDACGWVDRPSEKPFFLWISFAEPHNPYQVPEPYYDMFPPDDLPPLRSSAEDLKDRPFAWRWCLEGFRRAFPDYDATFDHARSNYHGMLRLIDDQVRRFTEHLERRGLRDDTLIVVLSDHGDFVGEYGLLRKGPGLPEATTRIPLIFNGFGVEPRSEVNPAHVSIVDLLPTLCSMAGVRTPLGVQGRDLGGLLRGEDDPARYHSMVVEQGYGGEVHDGTEDLDPRDDGFTPSPDGEAWGGFDELNSRTQSGTRRAIRSGDWKMVVSSDGRNQLYHLPDDPVELVNRWDDEACRTVRCRLQEKLIQWLLRLEDTLPPPENRYRLKPHDEVCP